ncbi:substrate-binding periplasmic protein [Desulfopila aestuarii]|uniref:Polar amino acid transport system substrate-binding protein n=1 Tax=Desulfopila aestuarii DSM 18488 TaxID=1121416 RepID=A0A1M7YMN7_9BACT|nr:ABC transporter substrate-binding protein [Desulfopila aestuarii]SHO53855.1 polar amino acid transport system substrate-binding protein [Desulfopila aestuarii DSM 18488]
MWNNILFIWAVIIHLLLTVSHASDEILIITEEWPPYNYSIDEKIAGFSTEIVKSILKVMHKEYELQVVPSMRAKALLENRPQTMMFSMFRTPEREAQYKWIGPLVDVSIYFYKRKDRQIKIESLADLKNEKLTVCCRHAGLIHDLLEEKGFNNLHSTATKGLSIYKMLLAGRCDIAISDADLGVRHNLHLLNIKLDDVFEKIPIPILEAELYIVGSKDISDEEIQQWQSALDTLKHNGVYDKILQTYL